MIFCHNETILIKDVAFMSLCVQYFHIMTKIHIMAKNQIIILVWKWTRKDSYKFNLGVFFFKFQHHTLWSNYSVIPPPNNIYYFQVTKVSSSFNIFLTYVKGEQDQQQLPQQQQQQQQEQRPRPPRRPRQPRPEGDNQHHQQTQDGPGGEPRQQGGRGGFRGGPRPGGRGGFRGGNNNGDTIRDFNHEGGYRGPRDPRDGQQGGGFRWVEQIEMNYGSACHSFLIILHKFMWSNVN